MDKKYIVFADEAWTHHSQPLNRYHNFFGGIFGTDSTIDSLNTQLLKIRELHELKKIEIKWSSLSAQNIAMYKAMIDCVKEYIQNHNLKYRQMFQDRSFHYRGGVPGTPLDVQYKLYYQFLKHSFGVVYLPRLENNGQYHIIFNLDKHSSQAHQDRLHEFIRNLPNTIRRDDFSFKVNFINSKNYLCLQICDVIMGAAGYHGNQAYLRRENGNTGITTKQKLKKEMAKYVYDTLREIENADRGTKVFHWFNTTGLNGLDSNKLHHKLRIWLFRSSPYQKNKGWEKGNLDRQGLFVADDFESRIRRD